MGMTKAQLEARLEGWRLVEAVQREETAPVPRDTAFEQMFQIVEFARRMAPDFHSPDDLQARLQDPWTRIRALGSNA